MCEVTSIQAGRPADKQVGKWTHRHRHTHRHARNCTNLRCCSWMLVLLIVCEAFDCERKGTVDKRQQEHRRICCEKVVADVCSPLLEHHIPDGLHRHSQIQAGTCVSFVVDVRERERE